MTLLLPHYPELLLSSRNETFLIRQTPEWLAHALGDNAESMRGRPAFATFGDSLPELEEVVRQVACSGGPITGYRMTLTDRHGQKHPLLADVRRLSGQSAAIPEIPVAGATTTAVAGAAIETAAVPASAPTSASTPASAPASASAPVSDHGSVALSGADEPVEIAINLQEVPLHHIWSEQDLEQASFHGLVGLSPRMQRVFNKIRLYAASDAPVLITGETGAGKEGVAHAIHQESVRAKGMFITVNCSAITETLFESEVFGHERGSFTGAVRSHQGKFERAHRGTLFLDEIGDLPLSSQAKLLRVLEEGKIERVGGEKPILVDVRIVAATNRNLEVESSRQAFRSDLMYRINALQIHVPPLRERLDDLAPLLRHFTLLLNKKYQRTMVGLTSQALGLLRQYRWPGNVRELRNLMERLFAENQTDAIGIRALREWYEERMETAGQLYNPHVTVLPYRPAIPLGMPHKIPDLMPEPMSGAGSRPASAPASAPTPTPTPASQPRSKWAYTNSLSPGFGASVSGVFPEHSSAGMAVDTEGFGHQEHAGMAGWPDQSHPFAGAVTLPSETIEAEVVQPSVVEAGSSRAASDAFGMPSVPAPELTRETLQQAFRATNGNITMAARRLGIHKATFYRRLKDLGLSRADLQE